MYIYNIYNVCTWLMPGADAAPDNQSTETAYQRQRPPRAKPVPPGSRAGGRAAEEQGALGCLGKGARGSGSLLTQLTADLTAGVIPLWGALGWVCKGSIETCCE